MRARRSFRPGDGEPLSPEELAKQAFSTAVHALARRPRSQSEIEALLGRRGFDREATEAAVTRLREHGYLDEKAVADAVLRDAARRRLGSRRVKQQLLRRGVPESIAHEAVRDARESDLERARELLARLGPEDLTGPRKSARALRLLLGRGYSLDVARRAVGLDIDVDSDLESDSDLD